MRVRLEISVKSEIISALIVMPFTCKLLNFANKKQKYEQYDTYNGMHDDANELWQSLSI